MNTENYYLEKPEENDFYDIEVHNRNMDTIDTELKKANQRIEKLEAIIKNAIVIAEEVE